MSGPREPWRSRSLSKAAMHRVEQVAWARFRERMEGRRVGRERDGDLLASLSPIQPRETRERDRSLRGKARRRARKALP